MLLDDGGVEDLFESLVGVLVTSVDVAVLAVFFCCLTSPPQAGPKPYSTCNWLSRDNELCDINQIMLNFG